jgi:membrane protein YqaA with SNARE-associated domain
MADALALIVIIALVSAIVLALKSDAVDGGKFKAGVRALWRRLRRKEP